MKIKGKDIKSVYEKEIVLRRGKRSDDITFKVRAVLDFDEFEQIVPIPKPQTRLVRGGGVETLDTPAYRAQILLRNQQRTAWMFIQSLLATPELEFDIIKLDDPSTWLRYPEEFKAAGLSAGEVNKIMEAILEVNSLTEPKVDEERQSFSQAEETQGSSSSPVSEPTGTASTEPAKE